MYNIVLQTWWFSCLHQACRTQTYSNVQINQFFLHNLAFHFPVVFHLLNHSFRSNLPLLLFHSLSHDDEGPSNRTLWQTAIQISPTLCTIRFTVFNFRIIAVFTHFNVTLWHRNIYQHSFQVFYSGQSTRLLLEVLLLLLLVVSHLVALGNQSPSSSVSLCGLRSDIS